MIVELHPGSCNTKERRVSVLDHAPWCIQDHEPAAVPKHGSSYPVVIGSYAQGWCEG